MTYVWIHKNFLLVKLMFEQPEQRLSYGLVMVQSGAPLALRRWRSVAQMV